MPIFLTSPQPSQSISSPVLTSNLLHLRMIYPMSTIQQFSFLKLCAMHPPHSTSSMKLLKPNFLKIITPVVATSTMQSFLRSLLSLSFNSPVLQVLLDTLSYQ